MSYQRRIWSAKFKSVFHLHSNFPLLSRSKDAESNKTTAIVLTCNGNYDFAKSFFWSVFLSLLLFRSYWIG